MKIVVIADVGTPERHTGDEAMFEVALAELAARGANQFTAIAPNDLPQLAFDIVRVPPIGFSERPGSAYDVERERRLELALAPEPDDANVARVVEAIATADALVIAGGGNMSASWPHHLYERVALLELAKRHGVPAIVSGQTIGPTLSRRQHERLAGALASARFVGVRDLPSLELLRELGVTESVALQFDDAITLASGEVDASLPASYVALSVHPYEADRAKMVREVAALAIQMHARSGLPVVIFPNTAAVDSSSADDQGFGNADSDLAAEIASAVADNQIVCVAALTTATATADGIRRSAALVSMRFHPLVFALAADVPCMAVPCDRYTRIKLEGVLHHAGLTDWQVPSDALATPIVAELFSELWSRRSEIGEHLTAIRPTWFDRHRQRWDALWSSLTGDGGAVASLVAQTFPTVAELAPEYSAARWSSVLALAAQERIARVEERVDTSEESAFSLQHALRTREGEIENFQTYVHALETKLATTTADNQKRKRRG